ncbi:MAG TPA: hypothetical protein VNV87_12265 [Acidimicrobiales bacterium]|nr:hypothetical protein [Acidimicrobiales bacterium]
MEAPLDFDPDTALWPANVVSRWPFTGAPAHGIWPKGAVGVDNTATMYVCTVAGEPGTWVAVGTGGGGITAWGQESTAKFAGSGSPVGVVTPSHEGDLYIDDTTPGLWQATGATSADWQQVGTSGQSPTVLMSLLGAQFPLGPFAQQFDAPISFATNTGVHGSIVVPAFKVSAGNVVGLPTIVIAGVDTTADDLPIAAEIYVTDLTGTNTAFISVNLDMPQVGPDQGITVDWTGTTASIAGSDLSWSDTTGVASAAGGTYSVSLILNGAWN